VNERTILCLNGGSSSLKFALFRIVKSAESRITEGAVEGIGKESRFWVRQGENKVADHSKPIADHRVAIEQIFAAFDQHGMRRPDAAGHRIVHGGTKYGEPQVVNEELKAALHQLIPFAPLHLPSQIAIIDAVSSHYPGLPQVACFDTSFHRQMPEIAQRFALPRQHWDDGVRRYGFHGLSYEYIVSKLGLQLGSRAIIAHLGNGASMVALKEGRPLDTTMGLTPTGGFMMSTRSGDVDPGIFLYLMRKGYDAAQLETLLNEQSGLLGVSGLSSDMKTLLEARATDTEAAQAIDIFCYQIRKFIGAFAAVLGGLDTLVFTGGIGERAAPVRQQVCAGLEHLGIQVDEERNSQTADLISKTKSKCAVRVIATDEDLMIARHTRQIVFDYRGSPNSRTSVR